MTAISESRTRVDQQRLTKAQGRTRRDGCGPLPRARRGAICSNARLARRNGAGIPRNGATTRTRGPGIRCDEPGIRTRDGRMRRNGPSIPTRTRGIRRNAPMIPPNPRRILRCQRSIPTEHAVSRRNAGRKRTNGGGTACAGPAGRAVTVCILALGSR